MKILNKEEALHKAAAYCSLSEKCESEVREKLARWGLAEGSHDEIVDHLYEESYLSEERYAGAYVKDKFRFNQWGRVKIRMMLRAKGVANSAIDEAIECIDEEEYRAVLLKVLEVKLCNLKYKSEYEKNGKLVQFAVGKGFEPNVVIATLDLLK